MDEELTKKWWKSKTLWVNVIMAASIIVKATTGIGFTGEEQAAMIVIVNLVLRAFTKTGLEK